MTLPHSEPASGAAPAPDNAGASAASKPVATHDHAFVIVFGAAMLALGLKLAIAFNTVGTNDVVSFYQFGRSLTQRGLEWTYANNISFNHPPVVAYYLRFIYWLNELPAFQQNGITFPLLLRLPGIVADFVVVMLLYRMRARFALPTWALVALALSPVSLMVAGFHGNTDPIMVMFLVCSACAAASGRPALCGLFLALSCQIKIVPLLLLPIFGCFWLARRKPLQFLIPFGVTMGLLWIQPLLQFPSLLIKNVLSYGSFWGLWGITYGLRMTGRPEFSVIAYASLPTAQNVVVTFLKLLIIGCVIVIAWRRRYLGAKGLVDSLALAWIIFFVFSPAVAPQYMVWIAPFVLVLSPTLAAYLMVASSLFLFFFYHVISGGFPWYAAISTPDLVPSWVPWSLLPWAAASGALILLWRNATRAEPELRLFSLKALREQPGR
jgi:hypothetical protein